MNDTIGQTITIPHQEIRVGTRMRSDLGDLKELADSIGEQGLIHPLTIDKDYNLIDGGRRFAAITSHLKWETIPCYVKNCTSSAHLRIMELEANIRRKEMTWKEMVKCVAEVHKLHQQEAANQEKFIRWTQEKTGELLNISIGNVNYCVELEKYLRDPQHPIQKADSMAEAFRILIQLKEDEVNKYESQFARELISTSKGGSVPGQVALSIDRLIRQGTSEVDSILQAVAQGSVTTSDGKVVDNKPLERPQMMIELSKYFQFGNCNRHMETMPESSVDHIITDSPYAVDMEQFEQSGEATMDMSRVAKEHDVADNILTMKEFFPRAFKVMRDCGFLVLWYDLEHHEWLKLEAEGAGFSVCRWPLVWVKTHKCKNQAAQYNFTKATEVAMVCRKGNATLLTPQGVNYWIGSNEEDKAKYGHPFVKPEGLWRWIFQAVAKKDQIIYDPFNGVGTCTLAAAKAGYMPRGSECNELHYNRSLLEFKKLFEGWYAKTHDLVFT
jgi:DNA modification methylase